MKGEERPQRPRFPWLLLVLLLASLYFFWVLPFQMGRRPVQVEFEDARGAQADPPSTPSP